MTSGLRGSVKAVRLWLLRKWLRFRWWLLAGGDTNRHPQHYTVWSLVFTGFLTVAGILLALGSNWIVRGIGIAFLGGALYIVVSFFIPLWLPPIWNEDVVKARREAAKRVVQGRLREVAEARAARRLEARTSAQQDPIARPALQPRRRPPDELARMLTAGAAEQKRLGILPLGTELRDIRRKIEKVRSMQHPIYWDGFRLPGARWDEYHRELASRPEVYKAVERAYVAANDVNEAVDHRRTQAGGKLIGPNPLDGLDEAYRAAGEALDALGQPRGEPYESAAQKVAREMIEGDQERSSSS